MRKSLVVIWLVLLFSAVGALFWYNGWVYHLPTPIPANYKPVSLGKVIKLNGTIGADHSKPLFLHFFNPDCPCSRFNISNFKSLVKRYGRQVNFAVVVMNNKYYTAKAIQDKFDLNIPVLFDASIATSCGVYSTPQAVLLTLSTNCITEAIIIGAGTVPTKKQAMQKWHSPACCMTIPA